MRSRKGKLEHGWNVRTRHPNSINCVPWPSFFHRVCVYRCCCYFWCVVYMTEAIPERTKRDLCDKVGWTFYVIVFPIHTHTPITPFVSTTQGIVYTLLPFAATWTWHIKQKIRFYSAAFSISATTVAQSNSIDELRNGYWFRIAFGFRLRHFEGKICGSGKIFDATAHVLFWWRWRVRQWIGWKWVAFQQVSHFDVSASEHM